MGDTDIHEVVGIALRFRKLHGIHAFACWIMSVRPECESSIYRTSVPVKESLAEHHEQLNQAGRNELVQRRRRTACTSAQTMDTKFVSDPAERTLRGRT